MTNKNNEYLFIASGMMHNIDTWGMVLGSSRKDINTISLLLNDNVYPPYISHKLICEDVIKIRDYLNDYLERTNE